MIRKISFFVFIVVSICVGSCIRPTNNSKENVTEQVYQRVLKSKTIRASYIVYPPYCIINPNSHKLSGIFIDVLEEMGRRLNMKILWTEEVGWGTVFEGLNNDRYDIHGSGLWENASRGVNGYFSNPLFYNPIMVWARTGDNRFIKNLKLINSPNIKIAVQDGAMEDIIAKSDYPQAQRISITQTNPWSDNLLNIKTGKADVTFAEPWVIYPFIEKNPGSISMVETNGPIRYFANSYVIKMGSNKFKSMINAALDEIIMDGTMDKILKKYENKQGEFLRVAKPYQN
jgi:ABC-type amino acid transport substrate-binding protein